ncbi:MAG: caspase family protein [Cyanobacteria bacterium J06638_22]
MARRYALVVGIDDYLSPLKPLSKTARDAEAVAQVLEDYGDFHVTRLIGKVTSDRLSRFLRTLLLQQATGQDVLIYFTGHGVPVVNSLLGETEAFLATSDCRVVIEGKQITQQQNGISFHDLNGLLQKSQLSSFVMLLDSCHSGDVIETVDKQVVQQTLTAFAGRDYYLITACRGFEQAYARRSEEHSIFTGALLEGLSEARANAEGEVNAEALAAYIKQTLQGSGQEPISLGSGGIITLVSYNSPAITKVVDERCPYRGLEPFTVKTHRFFFGRQQTVTQLRQGIEQANVVVLVGASGSGKSSVVRAGLIPALQGIGWRMLQPIRPGFEPMAELKRTIAREVHRRSEIQIVHEAVAQMSLAEAIACIPGNERLLLFIDQFEEIFTVCTSEVEQRQFIDCLTQNTGSRLAIVIALRADFVDACLSYPKLTEHLQHLTIYMTALEGENLSAAIRKPAQSQGYRVDPALVSMIARDMAQERHCLPLLQFTLERLWAPATDYGHNMTLEHYEQLGGLKGALNAHADRVYGYQDWRAPHPQQERSPDEKEWIRRIFLYLVRTGEDTRDTRQRRTRTEILSLADSDPMAHKLLETVLEDLVEGRLLVSGDAALEVVPIPLPVLASSNEKHANGNHTSGKQGNGSSEVSAASSDTLSVHLSVSPLPETRGNLTTIDLAHEALMDGWATFAKWRQSDRDVRRLIDRMDDACREWRHHHQHPDFLLPKALMVQAAVLEGYLEQRLPPTLQRYYQASLEHEHNRTAAFEWAQLEREWREDSRRLQMLLQKQGVGKNLAATLAMVHRTWKTKTSAPVDGWGQVVPVHPQEPDRFQGHEDYVRAVAFAPQGNLIVSGSDDCTVRLWQRDGTPLGEPLRGHENYVLTVAVSPDREWVVSGSADRTLRLWPLNGTSPLPPLLGHSSAVLAVAVSPDGRMIASASADRTLRFWSKYGKPLGEPLLGHEAAVRAVAFSPDGHLIATASDDHTLRLWKRDGTLLRKPFVGHEAAVLAIAFTPDGQGLVSGGIDRTIRQWALDGTPIWEPIRGHKAAVLSVMVSPDGQTIVSGSEDCTLRLWKRDGSPAAPPLQGHENYVRAVAFSPDGQTIISGSADRTIRLWQPDGTPIAPPFQGHKDYIRTLAFSPDGSILVSGSDDRTLRLWDMNGASLGPPLQGHKDYVRAVAFSPDGTILASGSDDRTLRLWNVDGQPCGSALRGHRAAVLAVTFSPDGQILASGSADRTLRLWKTDGTPLVDPLVGHEAAVLAIAFSPDGEMLVSGGGDRVLRLWYRDGTPVCPPFQGHEDYVRAVAFSPDGEMIASAGDDHTIRLWQRDGTPIGQPFQGHGDDVRAINFLPDGQRLVSGGADGTVRLWRLNGTPVRSPLRGHGADVRTVAVSPDGQRIASAGDDGIIRLWKADGTPLWQGLSDEVEPPLFVTFTPDGQVVMSGTLADITQPWRDGSWEDWVRHCCESLRRHPLFTNPPTPVAEETCDFCRQFMGWEQG